MSSLSSRPLTKRNKYGIMPALCICNVSFITFVPISLVSNSVVDEILFIG